MYSMDGRHANTKEETWQKLVKFTNTKKTYWQSKLNTECARVYSSWDHEYQPEITCKCLYVCEVRSPTPERHFF